MLILVFNRLYMGVFLLNLKLLLCNLMPHLLHLYVICCFLRPEYQFTSYLRGDFSWLNNTSSRESSSFKFFMSHWFINVFESQKVRLMLLLPYRLINEGFLCLIEQILWSATKISEFLMYRNERIQITQVGNCFLRFLAATSIVVLILLQTAFPTWVETT
jgi:hypothetical protein